MRCTQTVETGAYVLGALPPVERSAYEQHLTACAECRDQVAELAGLPGLLGRLDAHTASSIGRPEGAPPALLDRVLASAQTERLRRRRRGWWERGLTLATAAALALVVGLGVSTMSVPAPPAPVMAAMSPVDMDEPVTALVAYWPDPKGGGTEIRLSCAYATEPGPAHGGSVRLDLWIFPRDGGAGRSVWYWDAGPGDRDTFWAETDLRPDQIGRLEIREGDVVLLTYRA